MKPPTERIRTRFPFTPIERIARARLTHAGEPIVARTIADVVGISRRHVLRLRNDGIAGEARAERLAIAVGHHPIEFWPNWDHGRDLPGFEIDVDR